jgi:hypothetical protein
LSSGFRNIGGGLGLLLFTILPLAGPAWCTTAVASLTVLLDDGSSLSARSVEPRPQSYVRVVKADGTEQLVPHHKIRSIIDDSGHDWTASVLRDRRSIGVSPGESGAKPVRHGPSFRPHPLPTSKAYYVYDFGVSYQFADDRPFPGNDNVATSLELGYMRNLSAKNAVGFSVLGFAGDEIQRLAVRGRYRRWLSPSVGLDGTAGVTVAGGGDADEIVFPGFIASAGLQFDGMFGVALEMEQVHYRYWVYPQVEPYNQSDVQWRVRGQLGGVPGVAGTVLLVAFGILVAARRE